MTIDPKNPADVARALIGCESVTPEEGGALELLESLLAPLGFAVDRPVFSAENTPDIENLYARRGEGDAFVFAGHTDVVPPGDVSKWRHNPFVGAAEAGELYGRGAVDMKGAVACMVAAVARRPDARPVAFLITGDEEGPAINGTAKLLGWATARGERFSACLLGEPSNPNALGDEIKVGRRGSLSGTVTIPGVQGHVAYPHRADNPVRRLPKALVALMGEALDDGTDHFQPSNLEVVSVESGAGAFNVIPGEAKLRFNVRYNDRHDAASLRTLIAGRLDGALGAGAYLLDFEPHTGDAFLTPPGAFSGVVADAVEAETGRRPALTTTGGTSDARFIKSHCPVVEFGLVGQTMHQVDERVSLADLETLTRIYERVLEKSDGRMIDRTDVAREIGRQVKAGFDGRADILEGILEAYLDPDDLEAGDEDWIKAEIARQFAEKRTAEAGWPARTDWDRLDDAFRRIEARGVLALHDAGVTQSDAISDAGQEYFDRGSEKSGLDGYVFYHRQDVDQAVEAGELYLGFGRFRDDVDLLHAPSIAIAELVTANFAVEWPADPDKRIHVSKIVWLKRSPKD